MKTSKLILSALAICLFFPFSVKASDIPYRPIIDDEIITIRTDAEIKASRNGSEKVLLKDQPSEDSDTIEALHLGDTVQVLDQEGKYFKVSYLNVYAYVFWENISFIEDSITSDSDLLGNSTIEYVSSDNRDNNLEIACNTINGYVLQPGEEFRWSKIVGNTTLKKGYKEATVISGGRPVKGLGGGVCQVSTALYNALLDTTITPTEHHKHSLESAYSKNDATVAHGSKDFAFINEYNFPIKIEAYSYKGTVFINIRALKTEPNQN